MTTARMHKKGLEKTACGIKLDAWNPRPTSQSACGVKIARSDDWSKVTCKRCQTFYRSWHWQEADQAPWENN